MYTKIHPATTHYSSYKNSWLKSFSNIIQYYVMTSSGSLTVVVMHVLAACRLINCYCLHLRCVAVFYDIFMPTAQ